MRQWDHLHPYNAAQILKLTGQANPIHLQQSWHETLTTLRLNPTNDVAIRPPDHSRTNVLADQHNLPGSTTPLSP